MSPAFAGSTARLPDFDASGAFSVQTGLGTTPIGSYDAALFAQQAMMLEGGVTASDLQERVTGLCPVGASIRQINDGSVLCETDDDTGTTYSAGSRLILEGTSTP